MNLTAIAVLGVQIAFVAFAALLLFRLRERIGLGPLYIFVGTNQFLSVVLAASVYLGVAPGVYVSPGSAVLFTSSLFVILLVYLGTDIPTTRGLILGVFIANITLTVLLWFTGYQMSRIDVVNPLNLPIELFIVSPRVFAAGSVMLLIDFLLVVMLFQWLRLRRPDWSLLAIILLALTSVLVIDALSFSTLISFGEVGYGDVLRGQLAGKVPAGLLFGFILFAYLRRFEPQIAMHDQGVAGHVDDVFSIFTYRERYREMRDKYHVAAAASLAKSRFLANMSHELRTPLNAIIGFTSVMLQRKESVDDQHRMLLGRVWANGMHLLELINGLLDLSKIESGRNELDIVEVDLSALIAETVTQLQIGTADKPIKLRAILPDKAVRLSTDRMRFKQVLINLVGNALKFTEHGAVDVTLAVDDNGKRPVRLDVSDSGVGIEPKKIEQIFEPFFHEDAAVRGEPGVGLGLAIARALCEQMGHALEVTSEPGKGSTFSILFFQFRQDERSALVAA